MLAINWFEVMLPKFEYEMQVEAVAAKESVRIKKLGHRTIWRQGHLYHVVGHRLDNSRADVKIVSLKNHPTIASYAIEDGFANKMAKNKFDVRLSHVGGTAVKEVNLPSEFQDIYTSLDGLAFRCFFGFGDSPDRWGLILRYITRHRFRLTLEDSNMRRIARGKRIVQHASLERASFRSGQLPYSGYLSDIHNGLTGTLIAEDGTSISIDLRGWTLPCNPENLNSYIRLTRGAEKVGRIAVQLQKEALALKPNGRINDNYAKDQLSTVQKILHDYDLNIFELTLLDKPTVRLKTEPLLV